MPVCHINEIRKRRPLDADGRKQVDAMKRVMSLQVAGVPVEDERGVTQADVAESDVSSPAGSPRLPDG